MNSHLKARRAQENPEQECPAGEPSAGPAASVRGAARKKPVRILLVEDSEDDALLLQRKLKRGGISVFCERVETEEAMHAALAERTWDVIIADHSLPVFSGLAALRVLQESGLDLPFIIVSGTIRQDVAVASMKAGARDYIMKGDLARLLPAIEREMDEAEERRKRRRAEIARREEAEISTALERVAREMICSLDAPVLLDGLCKVTADVLQSDRAHTMLWESGSQAYEVVAGYGDSDSESTALRASALPGNQVAALCGVLERKPVVELAGGGAAAAPVGALRGKLRAAAVLCMALRREGKIIGFQTASYRDGTRRFSETQRRIGEGIVQLATMALENARMACELQAQQREMALLRAAAAAANQASGLAAAAAAVVGEVCRFTGWRVGRVCLPGDGPGDFIYSDLGYTAPDLPEGALSTGMSGERVIRGVGLAGRALSERTMVVEGNGAEKPNRSGDSPIAADLRAGVAVPVLVDGDVVAIIEFRCAGWAEPTERHRALLSHVIAQLAFVGERARARAEIQRLNADLREQLLRRTGELEEANSDLEIFRHSVSSDLRAPLSRIDGFSQLALEDAGEALNTNVKNYLERARLTTQRMGDLVDGLLEHSEAGRCDIHRTAVDLSRMARAVVAELREEEPQRQVEFAIADDVTVSGDRLLLRVVLKNLIGNAWTYSSKRSDARIEFGVVSKGEGIAYFIRDNGSGFDMQYAGKLFEPFQRLHSSSEFAGNGVGLATVQRIVRRHGGRVWAKGEVDKGATFFFTLAAR